MIVMKINYIVNFILYMDAINKTFTLVIRDIYKYIYIFQQDYL